MKEMKACLFDMDGVVVDNKEFHIEAWKIYADRLGFKVNYEECKSWFGYTNNHILKKLFNKELAHDEMEKMGEEKEVIYRDLYAGKIVPLHGLPEFIESLRKAGIKIALATSAPSANVHFTLEKTFLSDKFETIVDGSMVKNGKPDPEIFLKAAQNLGVTPECTLVFEDSFHGINAAHAAGMKVIGVATTHQANEIKGTHAIIKDFSEITLEDIKKLYI
jgi:beta-phosphoglucomutase